VIFKIKHVDGQTDRQDKTRQIRHTNIPYLSILLSHYAPDARTCIKLLICVGVNHDLSLTMKEEEI